MLCAMFLVNTCDLCLGLFISLVFLLQVMGGITLSGEVIPANPKLPVGENLTLTCSFTNYSGPLDSSSLFFALGRDTTNVSLILSQFYSVVSPTAIRLLIPFVNHTHQNWYRCYIMNDTEWIFVNSTRVQVGSPPDVITEIDVVSRNFRDLNVTWCTKNIRQDLATYDLSWTSTNYGLESCPKPMQTNGSKCYTCIWGDEFFYGTNHLVIRGSSIYGHSTSNFTINPAEYVKPDPVSSLKIEPLNSISVRVKWNPPPKLAELFFLNYTLTLVNKPHSPLKSIVVKDIESIVLNDLHPASIYTFGIRCILSDGGNYSDETTANFKMPDDIPAIAPESPVGWFHSLYCLDGASSFSCAQNRTCLNVTFYWQSIPEHLRNGEILGYHLQYEDPSGNHSIHVNSTSAQVGLVLRRNHVLRLSAFTAAGHSVMRSIVFQANCSEMPKSKELFAEHTLDKHGVLIQWNREDEATNYSLLYCQGKDKSCLGEPMLKVISPDQTSITLPNITEHIFALAVNTERGTSGLSWINCFFDYNGPAFAPKIDIEESKETETVELIVKWDPVNCDELPRSGVRPGRVLNYTVTYGVTGTDREESLTVAGNVTKVILLGLSVGSNYTISVHGNTRTGSGQAKKVFYLLNPTNKGDSQNVLLAALISCSLITIVVLLGITACYIRKRLGACWLVKIKTPPIYHQSSQPECQENGNYSTSVDGYTVVSKDLTRQFQGYKFGKELKEYEQSKQDTEGTQLLDFNHNESSCFKGQDCSYQSSKDLKEATEVEALLYNSSESTDSVDPYDQSSEMGYASANMASMVVPPGPPHQPVNIDSSFNDSSTSWAVGLEKGPVEQEFLEDADENVCNAKRVVKEKGGSTASVKTDEDSASGGYSKASYAI